MRPLALRGVLPTWDLERRHADLDAVRRWVRRRLGVTELDRTHERLDGDSAREAARAMTVASDDPELQSALERVLQLLLPELDGRPLFAQRLAHFRILVPGDGRAAVPPHTDYGFGHDLRERNLWLALTDAEGPNALHAAPLLDSLGWISARGRAHAELEAPPSTRAQDARAGDVLLFTPLHVHHARTAVGRTRVSVDLRVVTAPPRRDATFRRVW